MDTRTTRMMSQEEKSQSSTKQETQGDLWKEIAEEGYDRTYTPEELSRAFGKPFEELVKGKDLPATAKQQKQETPEPNATASTAPIIEDGKTLDELVPKNDALGQHLIRTLRARGATDQEIWQFMLDN